MPLFEFQLTVTDEPDLFSGHKRKKEGDIVNITKHPSVGNGRKVIDEYLIVVVNVMANITLGRLRDHFKQRSLAGGYNEWELGNLYPEDPDDALILNSGLYTNPARYRGGYIERPEIIGKNRYCIELLTLKSILRELNLNKVRDKTYIYQPFKTVQDVLMGKPLEFEALIDCGTKPDEFISVEWSDTEPIVWDNALDKAVGPSDLGWEGL